MMGRVLSLSGGFVVLFTAITLGMGAEQTDARAQRAGQKTVAKKTTGDDVFQANCQRCHMPPMSITPRTTGTVIMHMRTRARLSREDEVKLLRFMAP